MANKRGVQYAITKNDELQRSGNASKGITSARLVNTKNDVVDLINRSHAPFAVTDESRYHLNDSYHAVTSCLMSDTYDEGKGKDIAKRKCLLKYNEDKLSAINLALADIRVIEQRLMDQKALVEKRMLGDREALDAEIHGA